MSQTVPEYAVYSEVHNLSGSPKESEFSQAEIEAIIDNQNAIVNDEMPFVFQSGDIGYEWVSELANYLSAIEVRKQWYDLGNKVPEYEKHVKDLRAKIAEGFPESDKASGLVYSDLVDVDYLYFSPRSLGGSLYSGSL
jgi:hypothetical protein